MSPRATRGPAGPHAPVTRLTFRLKEVAASLGVPYSTTAGWAAAGLLPVVKVGRVSLVRVDDLAAFLDRHRIAKGRTP